MIPSDPGAAWRAEARIALGLGKAQLLLVLGGTATAAVPGISAAGATPESRLFTAAADAELLLLGPMAQRPHALPPLPAGVSPALISWVALQALAFPALVLDAGCAVAPAVPHLRLGLPPAQCLSSGTAMGPAAVARRRAMGKRLGRSWRERQPGGLLVLAECVPGGTSTAEAVLTGLGLEVQGLVSGSLRSPPHGLRAQLVAQGLALAGGLDPGDPLAVLCALGDPMQALAVGLLEGLFEPAFAPGPPPGAQSAEPLLLLAGGSQMAALLALALALAPPAQRRRLAARTALVTTAWVAEEPGSNLGELLQRIGQRWQLQPLSFSSSLRFDGCQQQALRDYEAGYVKEGVGAGGLAFLTELAGIEPELLAAACDRACGLLLAA